MKVALAPHVGLYPQRSMRQSLAFWFLVFLVEQARADQQDVTTWSPVESIWTDQESDLTYACPVAVKYPSENRQLSFSGQRYVAVEHVMLRCLAQLSTKF